MDIYDKISMLKSQGYKFVFDRDIYCNFPARKCFSLEFIEDNPIEVINQKLGEQVKTITFYFNEGPSEYVRSELEKEIKDIFLQKK